MSGAGQPAPSQAAAQRRWLRLRGAFAFGDRSQRICLCKNLPFLSTNDYFQSPPMPFPAWLVGTAAKPPTRRVSSPLGPEHPRSLGDKARAGESPPVDAADTRTPSWERRFQLRGGTRSSRSGCGQRTRDTWWEGRLNTGLGFSIAYPTRPKNQTRRFRCHQEPGLLAAPTNPTRSQDGGSPAVPLQPGRGWRHRLAASSHILITQRVIK